MDAVNPWLDPSEVRQLAEQLLRPVAPARVATDPGFDSSFVGFTEPAETPESASLAESNPPSEAPLPAGPIHQTVTVSYPPKTPETEKPTLPLPPPQSERKLADRIEIFSYWLASNFNAQDTFALDHEGKVIFDESGHGRLHFMARSLALASRASGSIHVKIGPAAILQLITCETRDGRIVLGTLVPASLPSEQVQTITQVLIQTASPE